MIQGSQSSRCVRPFATQVLVRVLFLKMGEIQTIKERYSAEIYVESRWREPTLDHLTDNQVWRQIKTKKIVYTTTSVTLDDLTDNQVQRQIRTNKIVYTTTSVTLDDLTENQVWRQIKTDKSVYTTSSVTQL